MKTETLYTSDTNPVVTMQANNQQAIMTSDRVVCVDEEGPCFNCYAYGPYEETGVCSNHQDNTSFVTLSYEEFSKGSDQPLPYDEYKKAMDDEQELKKEQWNQYLLKCQKVIEDFYASKY